MEEKDNSNKNTEIEEALKEFEKKSILLQQQKKIIETPKVDEDLDLKEKIDIEEALKGFSQNGQSVDKQNERSDTEVLKKAEDAFREFEMKQKAEHRQEAEISSKIEINKSLTEFQQKYQEEQQQKVSIEKPKISKESGMVHLVMKLSGGAIKEERHAEYVLLGLVILIFFVSGYILFGIRDVKKISPPTEFEIEQLKRTVRHND